MRHIGTAGTLLAAASLLLSLAACDDGPRTIAITMKHSKFVPATLTVTPGEQVVLALRNDDPIDHEFILGTEAEQAVHEEGTEQTHDGAPGAASLEPGERQRITYTFGDEPLVYACHMPGHFAYGMKGRVTIA